MKKNYNLDELENFLSDSAEQHRMYPSDRVWRNIDQELHGNKKWPALTFGAILTGAIITAGLILVHPDKNLFTINTPSQTTQKNSLKAKIADGGLLPGSPDRKQQTDLTSKGGAKSSKDISFYADDNLPSSNDLTVSKTTPNDNKFGEEISNVRLAKEDKIDLISLNGGMQVDFESKAAITASPDLLNANGLHVNSPVHNNFTQVIGDESKDELTTFNLKINESVSTNAGQPVDKLAATGNKINNRWSLLFYATPSISYRYLSEAKIVDLHLQNGPIAPNLTHGVNNFVRHKPTTGYEVGAAVQYNLTPSVRVKTGLQFNLRGYSIDAYASKRETSTILLNRGYYTDSLVGISSISTQDGYKALEIDNRYWEISVPVGIDMRVVNWKKVQLYVAAGIQPTYQFNQSMYMISSDYKNYRQEPDLVRHWNVNTSLEAFMSYKAGGVTWQVGPQIRYQLLPGAINQYPVRERLIDYGFKIGVVKTLK
jgi:hypothetical protein